MGLLKDRHGTYYARHKVPERLQLAVAQVLGEGKTKQVWLAMSGSSALVAINALMLKRTKLTGLGTGLRSA